MIIIVIGAIGVLIFVSALWESILELREGEITKMDQAEFRQRAMIAAMQGFITSSKGWAGYDLAKEAARRSIVFADALLEANTVDELPTHPKGEVE